MSTEWCCENNVVASVVRHLKQLGWTIESVANTETRARGADIRASRHGETLIVEAKGYPSTLYARGENEGKPKPTKPGVQARHWYGQVLFDVILRQSRYSSARVFIALPDFPVFTNFITRTRFALCKLDTGVYVVGMTGVVENVSLERSGGR
jgi:hypothetical protein